MVNFHCRTANKRPPPTIPPPEADESNPHHGSPTNPILHSNRHIFSTGPPKLSISRGSLWPKDKILNVVFMDTWINRPPLKKEYPGSGMVTEKLKTAVQTYSKRWEAYCTIRFTFDPHGKRDIRVGFGPEDGNWSVLGKKAQLVPTDELTMNLQFDDDTDDDTLQQTTLHEFGHVLGCIHEHQSPSSPIKWKEQTVIDYYALAPNFWDEATVRLNVLSMFTETPEQYISSSFDPFSIMLYAFEPSFMENPDCLGNPPNTNDNTDLSILDKRTIAEMYPAVSQSTGRFVTSVLPINGTRRLQNPRNIAVTNPDDQSPPPKVAVGLSSLHIRAGSNVRIRTSVDDIKIEDFDIHIDTWFDTSFNYAACNWLESRSDSAIQVGSFNTMQCYEWNDRNRPKTASFDVQFAQKFKVVPTVVLWLNWLDTDKAHDTSVKAYATDVGLDGFKIHVESFGNCTMYSGGASWIAYPPTVKSITSGVITNTRSAEPPLVETTGPIVFKDPYKRQPKALIAVTSIDFAWGGDVHFDAFLSDIDTNGMNWRVDYSRKSTCRGIDATYIVY